MAKGIIIILQVVFTSCLLPTIFAKPHAFDDEGEISVPRSPKIEGPSEVFLTHSNVKKDGTLRCHIEGSPTPKVIWLKDGKETGLQDPYTSTFNVQNGTAELNFKNDAFNDTKYMTGNFTCIAANFLGRVHKLFIVIAEEKDANADAATSTMSHFPPNNLSIADGTASISQHNSSNSEREAKVLMSNSTRSHEYYLATLHEENDDQTLANT